MVAAAVSSEWQILKSVIFFLSKKLKICIETTTKISSHVYWFDFCWHDNWMGNVDCVFGSIIQDSKHIFQCDR